MPCTQSQCDVNPAFGGCLSAFATDARGAIKGCESNSKCDYRVNNDGSVDLFVINDSIDHVHCPPKGDCICASCRTGVASCATSQLLNPPPRAPKHLATRRFSTYLVPAAERLPAYPLYTSRSHPQFSQTPMFQRVLPRQRCERCNSSPVLAAASLCCTKVRKRREADLIQVAAVGPNQKLRVSTIKLSYLRRPSSERAGRQREPRRARYNTESDYPRGHSSAKATLKWALASARVSPGKSERTSPASPSCSAISRNAALRGSPQRQ